MKITIPAYEPLFKGNEHLRHGEIEIDLGEDVVKVIHARWEICCDGWYPYCSNCGYEPHKPLGGYDSRTPYCPNCGAKMRNGVSNNSTRKNI